MTDPKMNRRAMITTTLALPAVMAALPNLVPAGPSVEEIRRLTIEEVCRAFRVPRHLVEGMPSYTYPQER